jgi:hypothetical protein
LYSEKQKYFCEQGLTGVPQNDPTGKSVAAFFHEEGNASLIDIHRLP